MAAAPIAVLVESGTEVLVFMNVVKTALTVLGLLLALSLLGFGLDGLKDTTRISRALHRHPWQSVTGWHERRDKVHQTIHGPRATYVGALTITTDTGAETILRVYPLSATSFDALDALKGSEVWLAIGKKRWGAGALPPGAPVFLVARAAWKLRTYVKMFERPDDR